MEILITKIEVPKGYKIVLEENNILIYKNEMNDRDDVREIVNQFDSASLALIKHHWRLK